MCIRDSTYGPGVGAGEKEVKAFFRRFTVAFRKMQMREKKIADESVFKYAKEIARTRFLKTMSRRHEDTEWHIDFEDRCRTENFFELREKKRTCEAELASSVRSIQALRFNHH